MEDFLKQIKKCISVNNSERATMLIKQHSSDPTLSNVISVLVTELSNDEGCCVENILTAFAKECDPEEVLLQLITEIDSCVDDEVFLVLCRVLLQALLRLPNKRLNSLGWGLNAVHSYLSKISLPENIVLNEDEKILMDADPLVDRISFLCSSLVSFYADLTASCCDSMEERKTVILKFTLQFLGRPLAYLDLKSGKTTSKARRTSESVVKMIISLKYDLFSILELDPNHDIGKVDALALSTLFYLVLSENVGWLPKVYDNVYIFQESVGLITELFKHDSHFVQHNGLALAQAVIGRICKGSLTYLLLDSEHHSHFCKALTRMIVYSDLETYRKKALELYRRYLFLFDARGRYLLVYNLMGALNHTGIIGFTVTQYKDMLVEELAKPEPSPYFRKSNMYSVLHRFCHLPNREESDLVELADQIVAALNLLRYLIIRDKKSFLEYIEKLRNEYLEPLKKALTMSRAHYELKIKDLKEESAEGDKGDSKVSVTVAGHTLPELPTNEKIKFLNSALTTFDVIENLLSRINELIEL